MCTGLRVIVSLNANPKSHLRPSNGIRALVLFRKHEIESQIRGIHSYIGASMTSRPHHVTPKFNPITKMCAIMHDVLQQVQVHLAVARRVAP